MARGAKKETALTQEEKLAQALVPEAEHPYRVPENWRWVRLSQLISTSKEKTEDFSDASVKYIGLENMETNTGIVSYGTVDGIKSLKNVFTEGQILYGKLRPYLNKHDIATFGGVCSTDILVFDTNDMALRQYVNRFFDLQFFIEYAISNSKGINLPRVSENVILDAPFPLPPLPEQQRIVDRIESLFAKLDEAREKAQVVVDGFEDRKAAILHKAFTGELAAGWRKTHSDCESNWKSSKIGDLTDIVSSRRIYKEEYTKEGIPFFRSSEVVELYDIGYTEPTFFISRDRYEEIKNTYGVPEKGDLLVTSVGTIGKTWIVDDREFYYKDGNLTQVKKSSNLDMRFLQFFIMSNEFKMQVNSTISGTAYNALTIVKFKSIELLLPSMDEQLEIVRVLENMFTKEQQAKDAAEQVIDQINTMKKAILARAFRGELGTNDPAEESAEGLLKQILFKGVR